MKVKLLKPNWPHERGEVVEVNSETGKRWLKIKLATEVVEYGRKTKQGNPKRPAAKAEPAKVETKVEEVKIEPEEVMPFSLEDMNYMELREQAKEKGMSIYSGGKPMNKQELVEALKG